MLLSILLSAGFNLAYYGKDQMYFSQTKWRHRNFIQPRIAGNRSRTIPRNSAITRTLPMLLSREKPENQKKWLADPVDVFARWMRNPEYAATYFIITRSQKAEVMHGWARFPNIH